MSTVSYKLFPSCPRPILERLGEEKAPNKFHHRSPCTRSFSDVSYPTCDATGSLYNRSSKNMSSAHERRCLRSTKLIPLRLGTPSDERSSCSSPSPTIHETRETAKPSRRKLRLASASDISFVPHSENEWKAVMHAIKVLYLRGKYKCCSTRCKTLLESMRDTSYHLLYHIYLSAYRASSLEMMAFSLPSCSSEKLLTYQEALGNYQAAILKLKYASTTDSVPGTPQSPDSPSKLSSARSSIDSIFSQYSETSSTSSSAAEENFPRDREISSSRGVHQRPKKKVSFSISTDVASQWSSNSSENELAAIAPISPSRILDFFPSPPNSSRLSPPASPAHPASSLKKPQSLLEPAPLTFAKDQANVLPTPIQSPSPTRLAHLLHYYNLLTSLCNQFTSQKSAVERVIKDLVPPSINYEGSMYSSTSTAERLRRLKAGNWTRKRFDGSRYRRLCDEVMSELQT